MTDRISAARNAAKYRAHEGKASHHNQVGTGTGTAVNLPTASGKSTPQAGWQWRQSA